MDISGYLKYTSGLVEDYLRSRFKTPMDSVPGVLSDSMAYSLMAGGKRVRPALAMAAYEACGGNPADIVPAASALEVIHTYSLIHDDLPAMDDDDLRRGRPTNHKVFGDAIAILAGDGLLTEAFLMLAECAPKFGHKAALYAVAELSIASGARGMVGGQAQDIMSEKSEPEEVALNYIHAHKTGALIKASVRLGGILHGADDGKMHSLTIYGQNLGLAFQVVDDILDISGDELVIGKPVGSDLKKKKMTYPSLYGLEESRKRAEGLIEAALSALDGFKDNAGPLRGIAQFVAYRSK